MKDWIARIPSTKTLVAIVLVVAGVAFFLSEGYDPKEGLIGSVMDSYFGICFEHHDEQIDYYYGKRTQTLCGSKLPYRWILASLFAVLGSAAITAKYNKSR